VRLQVDAAWIAAKGGVTTVIASGKGGDCLIQSVAGTPRPNTHTTNNEKQFPPSLRLFTPSKWQIVGGSSSGVSVFPP
jgi:hypothetical protein